MMLTKRRRMPNLCQKDGTIGKLFSENRDRLLNESKTIDDIRNTVKELFEANNLNTPKSQEITVKLNRIRSFSEALIYIQNIIFSAAQMQVS